MTELAVLVPVLNRPQNVKPLVESFLAGCPESAELHFLRAWNDFTEWEGLWVVLPHPRITAWACDAARTWPEKINYGVSNVPADWYLFAADDVSFVPGWWEATKELRDDPKVGVIGTNDSLHGAGNPRVAAGEHTCHPLVRSRYITDYGTVDHRGEAVHPGYRHWCVDDELVWTAKLRGAWAFCRDAVVEHHHPYWQGGEGWDQTYALGEAHAQEDMELWRHRASSLLGLKFR